jgi:hypothetical protein
MISRYAWLRPLAATLKAALWIVWACRVDVEIDDIDAALRLVVAIAGVPRSIAQANIADLGEPEATPLTAGRQTLAALAAKLIGQRFLSSLGVAKDDGAELAKPPLIRAEDLFPMGYCFFEQFVSGAWHGVLVIVVDEI